MSSPRGQNCLRLINVLIEGLAEAKKAEVNQIFFHDFLNKNDALFDLFSEFLLENTSNCTTFEGNCKVHFEGRGRVNRKINIDRGGTTTFPLTVFDGFVARKDAKEAALAVKNAASASSSSTTMAMDVVDNVSNRLAEVELRSFSTQTRLTGCDGIDIRADFFESGGYDMIKVKALLVWHGNIWRHKECEKIILESRTLIKIVVRCEACARFVKNQKRNLDGLQITLSMTENDPIFPTIIYSNIFKMHIWYKY